MKTQIQKFRQMLVRLHKDEAAPNTVEWILLIIVGLLVLVGIFMFAQYAVGRMDEAQGQSEGETVDATSLGN